MHPAVSTSTDTDTANPAIVMPVCQFVPAIGQTLDHVAIHASNFAQLHAWQRWRIVRHHFDALPSLALRFALCLFPPIGSKTRPLFRFAFHPCNLAVQCLRCFRKLVASPDFNGSPSNGARDQQARSDGESDAPERPRLRVAHCVPCFVTPCPILAGDGYRAEAAARLHDAVMCLCGFATFCPQLLPVLLSAPPSIAAALFLRMFVRALQGALRFSPCKARPPMLRALWATDDSTDNRRKRQCKF